MERSPRVVIVGAGISAIAAANLLINEGIHDVVVLEATDRVGGRIWSIDLGQFDRFVRYFLLLTINEYVTVCLLTVCPRTR